MARRRRGTSFTASWQLGLAVVIAAIMASSAQPQQQQQQPPQPPGQPANAPSCPPVQASLSPCVSYFIGNSSTPSDACCEQMRAMFQSQAPCLCAAMASAPSPLAPVLGGVQSLLPTACNLPPNACADATGSTTSGSAPAGGSSATPSTGATAAAPAMEPAGTDQAMTAGGGSKSVPGMPYSAAAGVHGGGASAAVAVLISSMLAYACMI
uniref:Bifunctional inhibitor/plant lipid transfer protein/seed storage helical domain-containing protein n=1 Tax=Oryza glumipatula TaxID=40148 RepID=A0A0D9ZHZ9_9ORYZ